MRSNQLRWLWLSWVVVVIDQFSKWIATHNLIFHQPVRLTSFFNLTLDFNQGAAFSFLNAAGGWQKWLFITIAVVVCIVIFIMLKNLKRNDNWHAAALAFIFGGAIGNVIDRLLHGYVVDFISWHINNYYWPTFNVADSAVCIGAVMLILGWRKAYKI